MIYVTIDKLLYCRGFTGPIGFKVSIDLHRFIHLILLSRVTKVKSDHADLKVVDNLFVHNINDMKC
jgi:hypothetical protein